MEHWKQSKFKYDRRKLNSGNRKDEDDKSKIIFKDIHMKYSIIPDHTEFLIQILWIFVQISRIVSNLLTPYEKIN